MKNNKGFSLVELIVVIAIMAILAAVAIPTFATFINKANVASDEQYVADLEYAVDLANTIFDEEATLTKITATNGTISAVEYTVGDVKVTIDTSTKAATAAAVDGKTVTEAKIDKVEDAAADVLATMDWTYSFKSAKYASGYPVVEGTN